MFDFVTVVGSIVDALMVEFAVSSLVSFHKVLHYSVIDMYVRL